MIAPLAGQATQVLERLVEVSPGGMFALDRDYRYLLWNPAMETIAGLRAEHVLGKAAFEVFPALRESGEDAGIRQALSGQRALCKSQSHFLPLGREGHYEVHYHPLKTAAGDVFAAVAVLAEVSEQEAAERRILETEVRFKNMADASPVLLWMSRSDGLCTFFNQTWLDFTGRSMEEEWGVGWAEGVHFEDFQHCMDTYIEAFNRRQKFEMEYRLRRNDGEFRWILDRGTPRYEFDGTFAGYIGSCVDITEHKRLEVQLREAVRARDEFISVASHELRTPITSLQLQLEVLLRHLDRSAEGGGDHGKLAQRAGRALDKTLYLANMVNVLLDASRVAEDRLDLDCEDIQLTALLHEVLERLRDPAQQAGCVLELDLAAEPVGRWDRFRISQVLTNLLENALKYARGQPICLRCSEHSGRARIDVIDGGPGIPPERHAQLFTRFARLSPRTQGGFGLGLWIAREIVNAHGGQIRLEKSGPAGSHFVVELPTLARHQSAAVDSEP